MIYRAIIVIAAAISVLFAVASHASAQDFLAGVVSINVTMTKEETGKASFYGGRHHGRRTASGERFNQNGLTAAHRNRKFGSRVTVTNQRNGKSVRVRITDRGPAKWTGRVIDLSRGAAAAIGMVRAGVVPVTIQ